MRLPYRGGNWNNAASAGVFALNLNNPRSNSNDNIGFRSALASPVMSHILKGVRTAHEVKGMHLPAKAIRQRQNIELLWRQQVVNTKSATRSATNRRYIDYKMKRTTNLYPKIYDFENLYAAYLEARKNKRYKDEVLKFSSRLEENLIEIQNELMHKTYKVGKYYQFFVFDPKKRLIMALPFKDRVVQWAIYRQLNPIFDKQFINDSYGCRIGKGTIKAVDRLQYWLRQINRRNEKYYCLKLDISKYFYRVDHSVLMHILNNKIKDMDVIWLLNIIVNSEDVRFGLPLGINPDECTAEDMLSDVGMPIGNLTSQMFANVYLNELDKYAKHELKLHYYIRYMDDILILHPDKKQLHEIKEQIELYINTKLNLHLNQKTSIRPISMGIEFVGFRVWSTHKKLRKSSVKRIKRRVKYLQKAYSEGTVGYKEINATMQSYFGIMQHFNSYGLRKKLLETVVFKRDSEKATSYTKFKLRRNGA